MRAQYDDATKQDVLARVAAGEPYRAVADAAGIPHGTVYSWVARARKAKGNGQAAGACMQTNKDTCMQNTPDKPKPAPRRKRRYMPQVRGPDGKAFRPGRVPDEYRCTARSKRTGERCQQPRAEGYTVCKYHGAGGGPPRGSKNALKTGEYETIWFDTLTEEEQVLLGKINLDKLAQVNNDLRLIDIRIRRMLQRIADLAKVDFAAVKQSFERGVGPLGPVDRESIENRATVGQIQAIEEALTRVQGTKTRLLDLKHKIEAEQGAAKPDIEGYLNALAGTAEDVWGDEDPAAEAAEAGEGGDT